MLQESNKQIYKANPVKGANQISRVRILFKNPMYTSQPISQDIESQMKVQPNQGNEGEKKKRNKVN